MKKVRNNNQFTVTALRKKRKENRIRKVLLIATPLLFTAVILLFKFSPYAKVEENLNKVYEDESYFGISEDEWKYHLHKIKNKK